MPQVFLLQSFLHLPLKQLVMGAVRDRILSLLARGSVPRRPFQWGPLISSIGSLQNRAHAPRAHKVGEGRPAASWAAAVLWANGAMVALILLWLTPALHWSTSMDFSGYC